MIQIYNRSRREVCLNNIEKLRRKMIRAANEYGMTNPLVLRYSQELDEEHNIMLKEEVPEHKSCRLGNDEVY